MRRSLARASSSSSLLYVLKRALTQRARRLRGAQVAVCVEPSSVCEIAWALGLPTVMVVDGRLEKGREQPSHWQRFVTSLRRVVRTQGGGGWGADMLVVATSAYVPVPL